MNNFLFVGCICNSLCDVLNYLVLKIRCKPWNRLSFPLLIYMFNANGLGIFLHLCFYAVTYMNKPPHPQMNAFPLFLTIYVGKKTLYILM